MGKTSNRGTGEAACRGLAETRAEMARRHRHDWQEFREKLLARILYDCDVELAKHAKAVADVIRACQEGERNSPCADEGAGPESIVIRWEHDASARRTGGGLGGGDVSHGTQGI